MTTTLAKLSELYDTHASLRLNFTGALSKIMRVKAGKSTTLTVTATAHTARKVDSNVASVSEGELIRVDNDG